LKKTLTVLALVATTGVTAIAVPALAASSAKVKVADDMFVKSKLTVKKGTKVTWNWTGAQPHNVTVTSGPAKFHSKTQTKGTFSETLKKPGTYKIVCTIHQSLGMVMTIKVTG
jgi:plastocyanin